MDIDLALRHKKAFETNPDAHAFLPEIQQGGYDNSPDYQTKPINELIPADQGGWSRTGPGPIWVGERIHD